MLGSNAIVIATILFLLLSAALLALMVYTMRKEVEKGAKLNHGGGTQDGDAENPS